MTVNPNDIVTEFNHEISLAPKSHIKRITEWFRTYVDGLYSKGAITSADLDYLDAVGI